LELGFLNELACTIPSGLAREKYRFLIVLFAYVITPLAVRMMPNRMGMLALPLAMLGMGAH
jgi:hypothetical protein